MAAAKKKKKATGFRPAKITLIACGAIAVISAALIIAAFTARAAHHSDLIAKLTSAQEVTALLSRATFYEGVSIEGVAVGGLTREEAAAAVEKAVDAKSTDPYIKLTYGGKSWSFGAENFTKDADVSAVLESAWRLGRTGDDKERLAQIEELKAKGQAFSVTTIANPAFIREQLQAIKAEVDKKPENAEVSFAYNDAKKEPVYSYTQEKEGRNLDVDKAYNEILVAFAANNQLTFELKPDALTPGITLSAIKRDYVKIASYSTKISNNRSEADRKTNILLSLKQFNNYVIMPGQSMSFNQTTGERTKEKGYQTAVFINTDQVYDETAGGGVCQTSTTLFNAALLAGTTARGGGGNFEIVRRYPHSWPSIYTPAGQDASVNWPSADLILRNNRNTPMFFRTYSQKLNNSYDSIVVEIYGEALEGTYTIESVTIETIECTTYERRADKAGKYTSASVPEKTVSHPRNGYTVETYQIFTKPGQEPVRKKLFNTVYQPIEGKVYYRP